MTAAAAPRRVLPRADPVSYEDAVHADPSRAGSACAGSARAGSGRVGSAHAGSAHTGSARPGSNRAASGGDGLRGAPFAAQAKRRAASVHLEFARISDRSRLVRRHYGWPFVVGRPFRDQDAALVILQSAAGTLNDGDRTDTSVVVNAGAAARIRGQGAMSVHRSHDGPGAVERTRLVAASDAHLDYQPELRVLFPRSRFTQRTEVALAESGTVLLADGIVGLRGLSADTFEWCRTELVITRDGVLLAHERSQIHGWADLPGRVGTFTAFGQVLALGVALADDPKSPAAELPSSDENRYVACSALPNDAGVAVRVAATDGQHLRAGLQQALRTLERHVATTRSTTAEHDDRACGDRACGDWASGGDRR